MFCHDNQQEPRSNITASGHLFANTNSYSGQLYMSITASREGLKILIKNSDKHPIGFTKNIVYKEVFNKLHPGVIQVADTPTQMQISETTTYNASVLQVVETAIATAIPETPRGTTECQNHDPSEVAEFDNNNALDDDRHPKKKKTSFPCTSKFYRVVYQRILIDVDGQGHSNP
ncbi:uncharacterized protein LOC113353965 [Papaver somniferum]|uniref:uncharacterized protein LOC113353965 n=1 Tax=Papaver somniferum TaxID=3469 RepID=UPI000E6FB603|nr:uncharacterized protein LOC113353965 [Papaver somniferum]